MPKKRQLSSPEELLDSKKNKLVSEIGTGTDLNLIEETSEEETSDISDLSNMATTTADSGSVITLKEADLKTIAGTLKDTFEPQISEMT